MTIPSRRFGDYDVFLLRDGALQGSAQHIIHLDREDAQNAARQSVQPQNFELVVNCFVLRGPNGISLVDSGCGMGMGGKLGKARDALAQLGIAPDDVSRVLVTHCHGDHVSGLLNGDAAYFPNAEVLFPETEFAFYTNEEAKERLPEPRRVPFALLADLRKALGQRLKIIPEGEVMQGVRSMLLPGHTPGHTGYLIGEGGNALLLFADALHLASLQPADPRIGMVFDLDAELASASRRSMLTQASDQGWTVIGCHTPDFQRVERMGEGFRMVSA